MDKYVTFVLGVAIGSAVTWMVVKEKYKKLADEEIKSVVDRFKNKSKDNEEKEPVVTEKVLLPNDGDKAAYHKIVEKQNYSDGDDTVVEEDQENVEVWMSELGEDRVAPFVISPEEFGEMYETETWIYYADSVMANEDGEIIDDVELTIGDALTQFGRFEDDAVCVRNMNNECDYEILKHDKSYKEVYGIDF